jgi:hypothetical protein
MKFRKKDYIIFYLITVIFYGFNLFAPAKLESVIAIFILAILPTIVLGTITNLMFKKK